MSLIVTRHPLVEGLVVNTNGGLIDTRTEVANSLHPLLGVLFARMVLLKVYDTSTGGTPKGIASAAWYWRVNGGSSTAFQTSATPWSNGGHFYPAGPTAWAGGARAGLTIPIVPTSWTTINSPMEQLLVDDFALVFTTDATTNPGTFNVVAHVVHGDVSY